MSLIIIIEYVKKLFWIYEGVYLLKTWIKNGARLI